MFLNLCNLINLLLFLWEEYTTDATISLKVHVSLEIREVYLQEFAVCYLVLVFWRTKASVLFIISTLLRLNLYLYLGSVKAHKQFYQIDQLMSGGPMAIIKPEVWDNFWCSNDTGMYLSSKKATWLWYMWI